jgi:type I restriction enzyme R subunit
MTPPATAAPSPNFGFLAYHDPRLSVFGAEAERLFAEHPSACVARLRLFAEVLARHAAARLGVYVDARDALAAVVDRLSARGAAPGAVVQMFDSLRLAGNRAVHEGRGDHQDALHQLKMARELGLWFQRAFGNNRRFDPGPFVPPPQPARDDAALRDEVAALRRALAESQVDAEAARAAVEAEARLRLSKEELAAHLAEERQVWEALALEAQAKHAQQLDALQARLDAELAAAQARALAAPPATLEAAVTAAAEAGRAVQLTEAETRHLIDQQLRDAGWDADTRALTHALGARPQKGKNAAIAEWPTRTGPVDYAVFAGLDLLAVIEAKRHDVDVPEVLGQAGRYSHGIDLAGEARFAGGPWGDGHRVPFLFATNGRRYLQQLATKSGIWFRDARRPQNLARPLDGWYTPDGLAALLKQDVDAAHVALHAEPVGYLDLRDYQIRAIQAVEAAIEGGARACLVAMATGTGKTRTAIGLVYRLIKAQRFRRVLFLVDREALGDQTRDALHDVRIENLQTFAEIYDVKGLDDLRPEATTKLHIATIQGLAKRVLGPGEPGSLPPVDQYDAIIVDECHRGYALDQEMSEVELRFRDLADYVSKYRRVLDHFDAVKIGLTATPAQHTAEIFGKPVFLYSYREAVIDGCLVDHEPPVRIVTALAESGIVWNKGEQMRLFDPRTAAERLVDAPDEVKIDVEGFNRAVITENFNRVVCAELARHIDPSLPAKTIIFCATDAHADIVVRLLKEAFAAEYGAVEDDAVVKITGSKSVDRPLARIRKLKNERLPSVAVTVDLLSTGVDVPAVANIVFLRRVKSRILYEQMLGRATRLCPRIEKSTFRIFDAVALYDALEDRTSMTPVVTRPNLSFQQLVEELTVAPDAEARALVLDQLVGKLQRRRATLKGDGLSSFETVAGATPAEVARLLKQGTPEAAAAWFAAHAYVLPILDAGSGLGAPLPVSEHHDALLYVERGYGKDNQRPADFLDGFRAFVTGNLNALPALVLVTQRPRDLTRAALRELKLLLDSKGYGEVALRAAYATETNAEIAASIMGFIRRAALGDALVPYAQRVDRALAKIVAGRSWKPNQRLWLTRIAKQIKADEVVDRAAFEEGQFKADGGFARVDKIFEGKLGEVLGELSDAVWERAG